jgi:hypothetical protein
MAAPEDNNHANSIVFILVGLVGLAIVIITVLTITAILNGPPAL